jgi:hypothetical protein
LVVYMHKCGRIWVNAQKFYFDGVMQYITTTREASSKAKKRRALKHIVWLQGSCTFLVVIMRHGLILSCKITKEKRSIPTHYERRLAYYVSKQYVLHSTVHTLVRNFFEEETYLQIEEP